MNNKLSPCFYESVPVGLKQGWKVQAFRELKLLPILSGRTTFVDTFNTPEEAIECAKRLKWEDKANNSIWYWKIIIERVFVLDDGE
jgi:hypothetical protein